MRSMRTYRQLFALITLFCLFFELCEPSTNFIRTSPSNAKQEQCQDHGPSLKNFETHAAQIAVSYYFEFKPVYTPTYFNCESDTFCGGYIRSIFQPPKAA